MRSSRHDLVRLPDLINPAPVTTITVAPRCLTL